MKDESQHQDLQREDRLILELLEATGIEELERARRSHDGDPTRAAQAREYCEVLGLLPYELEPKAPSREAKARLIAAVAPDGETRARTPVQTRVQTPVQTAADPETGSAPPVAANDNRLRTFLVAAVVALMMVGVSGWFYLQLDRQRTTVAQLQNELMATHLRLEEMADGRRDVVASLREVGLLSASSINWCPLRPPGDNPPQPQAHGSLILVMDHGRWAVRLHELEPAQSDKVYVLWFLHDERPIKRVSLGRGDRPVRIADTGLPMPMTAAAVTLEGSVEVEEPSGPRILYGHRRDMDRL